MKTNFYNFPQLWNASDINLGNDIAIIHLDSTNTIKYNKYVGPSRLEKRPLKYGTEFLHMGYGRIDRSEYQVSDNLRATKLVYRPLEDCGNLMKKFPEKFPNDDVSNFKFSDTVICALRKKELNNPGVGCRKSDLKY